ncbi:MAG TPA: hypothetical protein VHU40_17115, partial [Polyangia bacterium]|nr:hypothetical protein [Polyangia bacterium]
RFADDDAVRFALLFKGLDAAPHPSHVWLLSDLDAETTAGLTRAGLTAPPRTAPTRTALFAALADVSHALAARPGKPATLYIVYAGHGLKGRILLKPEGAPEAAITGTELRAAVAELAHTAPALRTYLFFDACRSQSLFTERGADPELGPDLSDQAGELEARAGAVRIGVLTAAASTKPAGEVGELGAGYFSHVLASGLAGAADADGDDVVSFAELAAFVAFNTERLTGQRPWFSPPDGDLAAVTMDLRGSRTRLDLSAATPGRYLIQATTGRPIFAEAWKGTRGPLRLALPAGQYRVLRAIDGARFSRADVRLAEGAPADLSRVSWTDDDSVVVARARGADDDQAPAFVAAFTPDVVSTLTAGYDAGRAPPSPLDHANNSVGVAFGLGGAPLDLAGAEASLQVRYRRRLGTLGLLEGTLHLARSSHTASGGFDLDRAMALLGGGVRMGVAPRTEATLVAALGGGPVMRRSGGTVSGDAFVPTATAGVGADVRIGAGWGVFAAFHYVVQAIRIDSARRASATPLGQLGVAYAF